MYKTFTKNKSFLRNSVSKTVEILLSSSICGLPCLAYSPEDRDGRKNLLEIQLNLSTSKQGTKETNKCQ